MRSSYPALPAFTAWTAWRFVTASFLSASLLGTGGTPSASAQQTAGSALAAAQQRAGSTLAAAQQPAGSALIPRAEALDAPRPSAFRFSPQRGGERSSAHGAYPLYDWPLDRALGFGLVAVNYADHDFGAGILDYETGPHTYDGHQGTDFTLHNFRLMDQGSAVLAAAPGVVSFIGPDGPGAFDRHCDSSTWDDGGNWIAVDNQDGTYAYYLHFRAHSLAVELGETVETGQFLGLVGSSGYSTGPHLHFETGDFFGGNYAWRDPFTGPTNPLPSLWLDQTQYVGDRTLRFFDIGVFSEDATENGITNIDFCDVMEGFHPPLVFGINEPQLDVYCQLQGNVGEPFRVEVLRPNDSVFGFYEDVLNFDARFDWLWVYWFWDGNVDEDDFGIWRVRGYFDDELTFERSFEVGANTTYGPRFEPAGRSFRVDGTVQEEALSLTDLSPVATLTLVGAPPEVILNGSVLSVGATSSQPYRSAFFHVEAVDQFGESDRAEFHLVDPSKIPEEVASTPTQTGLLSNTISLRTYPNPTEDWVSLRFTLLDRSRLSHDQPGTVEATLEVLDVAGRVVRSTSFDAKPGENEWVWDRRSEKGERVPAGTYFARITRGSEVGTTRLTLVP